MAASLAVSAAWATRADAADGTPFDGSTVKKLARDRAATAFKSADRSLPDALSKIGYDDYRTIRFDPAQSLWRGAGLPFEAQFFHRGWLYP
ncbi:MAG: glucan biosynthesis protein, partial [Janthinobacterium lividum]